MSDMHDKIHFVRAEMLPEQAPPVSNVGIVGWMRQNLFPSIFHSILTIVSVILIFFAVKGLLGWMISPTWAADSLHTCRDIWKETGEGGGHSKACWGVIRDRWLQLLYGFYPSSEYWRPNLALVLLLVALAPILFGGKVPKKLLWFSAAYLFIMPWLLWGGTIWKPVCAALGFGLAYLAFRWLENIAGTVLALLAGIVLALVWWLFVMDDAVILLRDIIALDLQAVPSRKFGGLLLSITIGVVAIAFSLPIGVMLALGRRSDLPVVKMICVGFIEFIRGVPLITLLFVASTLLNYFMPPGTNFDIVLRVMIMATLFSAAYIAEVVRGGLAALPSGQFEGADSLGLNYWQAQRLIVLPQALKISIPGIVGTFIGLFKDTTLVSIIGLLDPMGVSTNIRANSDWAGIVWELYGFIAVLFFIFCFAMSRYSMYLERKLQTGHH